MPGEDEDLQAWARRLRDLGVDASVLAALFPAGVDPAARLSALRAALGAETAGPLATSRYATGERLGRGGVGEVVVAHDALLERAVALKLLRPELQTDPETRARFLFEARTAGRLSHPGILPVHDLGALPDGRWFYTMPRLAGRTLRDVIDGLRAEDPATCAGYSLRRLMEIFERVCLTVAYAHAHDVVHRDLKPDNLLLGDYGEIYVSDWGLAKRSRGRADHSTTPGTIIGSLHYLSPEQVRGEPERIGAASDVWSLGVLLFELLTLQLPFTADLPVSVMFAIVSQDPPDPRALRPGVPEALAALCHEALVRDPTERTLSARALAQRVAGWLDGVEAAARRAARARELLAQARAEAAAWRAERAAQAEAAQALAARADALRPATPMAEREAVWAARQRLAEGELDLAARYARAVRAVEQSLEEHEGDPAHALLAELFWERACAARHDPPTAAYFEALARRHDRGALGDRLAATARLEIVAPGAIRVIRQAPDGPLMRDVPLPPDADLAALPAGSYVVEVVAAGRMPARIPVRLDGGARHLLRIDPPPAIPDPDAWVWIPAGDYVIGGDPEAPSGLPRTPVHLDGLLIGRHPVTMEAYCSFLNALAEEAGVATARAHAPRSADGSVCYLDLIDGRFAIPTVDADGDAWDPRWPALALNLADAQAYCAWLTARTGVEHRLPTEIEWEVAARGVDERRYPWGNGFDPVLCHMAESSDGPPLPRPVGSYPHDRSPFGVFDMAGLIIEWTATRAANGDQVQRGAACTSPAAWCRAAGRRTQVARWTTPQFGFRVARAVPEEPQ